MGIVSVVALFLRALLVPRAAWVAENPALRHQLGVLQRSVKRPRIHDVAESTATYMIRHRKPPSQTWRTLLENRVREIAAIDYFVVATVVFRLRYCLLVLRDDRRRVVHFNVTPYPTALWTARQVVEAFPFDEAPRFLIRDHDGIYGHHFRERVKHMGIA